MKKQNIQLKETCIKDMNEILQVEKHAFGGDEEAQLTSELLIDTSAKPLLSLLAFDKEKAVGHILFTRAYIHSKSNQTLIHILAPLAVIPEYQNQGIGAKLIDEGMERLQKMGSEMVFVLGHIDYYPKHGFIPNAEKLGYPAPYPIPEEVKDAWMVQSLSPNGFVCEQGNIICAHAMDKPEHWRE